MPSRKTFVLVVDDDIRILYMMQRTLELEGYQVLKASDGETAISVFDEKTPDLVLVDIMMPGMDGYTVCQRIREFSQVPIIMVTALNELGDIERGIDSGTDDFLTKPVNKWELITRVKTMLKLKHLSDKLERTLAYHRETSHKRLAARTLLSSTIARRGFPTCLSRTAFVLRRSAALGYRPTASATTRVAAPLPATSSPACGDSEL